MDILKEVSEKLQEGQAEVVAELVGDAVDRGFSAQKILDGGLLHGMNIVGEKFRSNEIFVPEVLMAARAMNFGTEVIKPLLLSEGINTVGKVVIGTVKGDLHDIGKNLVKLMMEGKGLEVIDLGSDVDPKEFVVSAIQKGASIIACSALVTTTMVQMEEVVKEVKKQGLRDTLTIMVGGAPVSQDYCERIQADFYAPDAASAADLALKVYSA